MSLLTNLLGMPEPRTKTLAPDDRVWVNGRPFIYSLPNEGAIFSRWRVHFPGGGTHTVRDLRAAGHEVFEPVHLIDLLGA